LAKNDVQTNSNKELHSDIHHRHHSGMFQKTPPPTELQSSGTITTLLYALELELV